jgi:AbrB family looped-hinge helix DNA binding protein
LAGTVGERGQVTIEKRIREELGIYAGDRAVQRVEDGRVILEIVPGPHRRSLAGALRQKVTRRPPDEADWERIRKTALAQPDPDRTPAGRRRRRS